MDQIEASAIFASTGRPRDGMGCVAATIAGVATTDSSEGVVMVDLGGDALSVDESQAVEAETTVDVRAGDVVRVTTDGVPGHRRSVTVTGVVGGGDRARAEKADASLAVASAADWYLVRDERPERPAAREPGGEWANAPLFPEGGSEGRCWRSTLTVRADGSWEWSEPVEEAYWSRLTRTASELTSEVKRRTELGGRVAELGTRVTQNATSIDGKVSVGSSGIGSIDSVASLDSKGLTIGRKVGGAWRGMRQRLTGSASQFLDQTGKVLQETTKDLIKFMGTVGTIEIGKISQRGPWNNGIWSDAQMAIVAKSGVLFRDSNSANDMFDAMVGSDGISTKGLSVDNNQKSGTCVTGVWCGSKVFKFTGNGTVLFSQSEIQGIVGDMPSMSKFIVLLDSGDDAAYRGNLTASYQDSSASIIAYADPQKNGNIRINWTIITYK